jgi:hypothetical protein
MVGVVVVMDLRWVGEGKGAVAGRSTREVLAVCRDGGCWEEGAVLSAVVGALDEADHPRTLRVLKDGEFSAISSSFGLGMEETDICSAWRLWRARGGEVSNPRADKRADEDGRMEPVEDGTSRLALSDIVATAFLLASMIESRAARVVRAARPPAAGGLGSFSTSSGVGASGWTTSGLERLMIFRDPKGIYVLTDRRRARLSLTGFASADKVIEDL